MQPLEICILLHYGHNDKQHCLNWLFLFVSLTVQQGGAVRRLTEALQQKEAAATELSQLIQELQALRLNITALRGAT